VAARLQHLEDLAHDPVLLLDRLVGIGVCADGDGARLVAVLRQFLVEQPRRIRLGEQLRFEIQPGDRPMKLCVGRAKQ
jgi:hypothetical protein